MVGYVVYRKRSGLSLSKSVVLVRPERPPDFHELGYRTALVPIFGADVSAETLVSAAKLIGKDGIVYAVFVLPVPRQLSLDAGLEAEEALGRSILESARIQGRRAGIKVRTGLIRTRSPGAALADEARRIGADVIYLSTLHAPASEQRIGLTASYLLDHRPCRIVIETGSARTPRSRSPDSSVSRCPYRRVHAPAGGWRMRQPACRRMRPEGAPTPSRHGSASARSAGWESGCKWGIGTGFVLQSGWDLIRPRSEPGWMGSSRLFQPGSAYLFCAHPVMAFRGYYDNTLDAKNRLTIPARLRKALAEGWWWRCSATPPSASRSGAPRTTRPTSTGCSRGSAALGGLREHRALLQRLLAGARARRRRARHGARQAARAGRPAQGGRGDRRRQPPGGLGPRGVGARRASRSSPPSRRSDRDRRVATLLDMTITHVPVLAGRADRAARPPAGAIAVDCTFGGGGHARLIAGRIGATGHADRDRPRPDRPGALRRALARGLPARPASSARRSPRVSSCCWTRGCGADCVYFDLGISSMQIDTLGARLLLRLRRAARHAHGSRPGADRAARSSPTGTSGGSRGCCASSARSATPPRSPARSSPSASARRSSRRWSSST